MSASSKSRPSLKTLIPAFLFVIVLCLSFYTTWQTSLYCLDGDASSELVLAHHLNETGRILSSDWYYSTELRVLNTQLVFAPLFSIFSDWTMVRFVGAMILQGLLVLSFFYLGRQAKLSWGARFLGGALLLLPVSTSYGRIVLYHSYYMPHIILGFMIVALFLSTLNHWNNRHIRIASLRLALLCALSFGSGLGLDVLQQRTAQKYMQGVETIRQLVIQNDLPAARREQAHLHALWQHDARWLNCLISHHHTRAVTSAMLRLSTALDMGWPVQALMALDDAFDALGDIRTGEFATLENLL